MLLHISASRCVITSMLHCYIPKKVGPVTLPPLSPDLNPCDFFLWGHLKLLVYATPVDGLSSQRQTSPRNRFYVVVDRAMTSAAATSNNSCAVINSTNMKGKVQTVLGLLEPEKLGITLTHEHLLHAIPLELAQKPLPPGLSRLKNSPVTMENLGFIRQYPYCCDDNRVFSEEAVGEAVKKEMALFKSNSGSTIVDNGSIGVRAKNQHTYLEKLSKETGVNIILGTGFYVAKSQSQSILGMSLENMAEKMREEILTGVDGTNIKCGLIGEIGCSWPLMPFEKLSLKSSATVQAETGCPVIIHPGRDRKAPEEILRIFQEAGGRIEHVVMGHLDRTFSSTEDLVEFASLGSFCELDLFGNEVSHYQHDDAFDMPSDAQRIAQIRTLVKEGYGEKIVISHDIHTKHRLGMFGGHGYSHILVNIIPKMSKRGLTDEDIQNILIYNPMKCLTFL